MPLLPPGPRLCWPSSPSDHRRAVTWLRERDGMGHSDRQNPGTGVCESGKGYCTPVDLYKTKVLAKRLSQSNVSHRLLPPWAVEALWPATRLASVRASAQTSPDEPVEEVCHPVTLEVDCHSPPEVSGTRFQPQPLGGLRRM